MSKQNLYFRQFFHQVFKMTTLQSLSGASRIPGPHDKVYKDECFFSFDSPVRYSQYYPFFGRKWFHNFQGICSSQVITIAKTEKAQLWKKSKEKNLSFSIMLSSFPSFLNLVTQKFSSFYLLNSANISSNFWVPLQQDRIAESY